LRKRPWKTIGVVAMCAGLPPDTLHAALAAAAGTLFEAAPFVLVAELAAVSRIRLLATFAALGGCGCSRGRTPGAWSLPATALCWLAFGPAVAIARAGLAAAVWARPIRAPRPESVRTPRQLLCADAAHGGPDALAELAELVPAALLGFIGAQLLGSAAGSLLAIGPAGCILAFGAGCALGAVVPCSTAGVALASAVAVAAPPAAAGLLATAGIVRLGGSRKRSAETGDARIPTALLALALALLAWRGPSGLVNPRLIPLAAFGAAVAAARLPRGLPPSGPSAYLVIAQCSERWQRDRPCRHSGLTRVTPRRRIRVRIWSSQVSPFAPAMPRWSSDLRSPAAVWTRLRSVSDWTGVFRCRRVRGSP
jgi:hypothetical protein